MGIAIASGMPPAQGLLTASIGGLIVGLFGGAPLQIAGPSAGLTVIVVEMVGKHGAEAFAVIVVIAGLIQVLAGILKLGRFFRAVSPAVIRGMLSGIGVLIIASQLHVMIDDKIHESGLRNVLMIPTGVMKALSPAEGTEHGTAALIGVGTLLIVVLWEKLKPARLRMLPGALLGASAAAIVAAAVALPIRYVAVPSNLLDLITFPTTAVLSELLDSELWLSALALAFVASAETLVCATALSGMHSGSRTDYDRELAVQGVANLACGLVGTLPVTGAISRSTANVQAGAKTRASVVLHVVWIAIFVVLLPDVLALVPTSSLAAILIYVGFKLLHIKAVSALRQYGRPVIFIFAATLVGVVAIDLLSGIMLGLTLSTAKLVYSMAHLEIKRHDLGGNKIEIVLQGAATFLGQPVLGHELEQVPVGAEVTINVDELEFVDHACLDLLEAFLERHEEAGGKVTIEWDALLHSYGRGGATGATRRRSTTEMLSAAGVAEPARTSRAGADAG